MRLFPPPRCECGLGALTWLLLLRCAAAPVLPRADTCTGGPGFVVQDYYELPAEIANGHYANAACGHDSIGRAYDRQFGHTVFRCDASKVGGQQWQVVARGDEDLLCVLKELGGCSGSPDAAKHYESRTLGPRAEWIATCADGYRAENLYARSIYKCEVTQWVHSGDDPAGQPAVCTAEPGGGYCTGPPGAHFRSVTATEGGHVVAACEDGYVATGSSVFVCRATSQNVWQAAPGVTNTLVCTPPTCGASPAEHTKDKCVGTQVGQQCKAECANRYTPHGNPTYTCVGGAWTGGSLRCLKSCTLPQSLPQNWHTVPLEGKHAACVAGQALAAGENCTIGCQAGYSQEVDGAYMYECGMDSQLVPPSPDCNICPKNTFNPTPGASTCKTCGDHCTGKRGSLKCNCTTPALHPCNGVDCGHGSCQPLGNTSHTCQCEHGWRQEDFGEGPCIHAIGCDSGPCQNGGTCVTDDLGGFACRCIGPTWKWGGKTCTEPMGCHDQLCSAHGQCTADPVTGDGFSCNCTQGWSGKNCKIEPPHPLAPDGPPSDLGPAGNNNSRDFDWKLWGPVIGGVVALLLCLFSRCHRSRNFKSGSPLLRESLFGGPEQMPDAVLTQKDVGAKWSFAQQQFTESTEESRLHNSHSRGSRQPRGGRPQLQVMFRNEHVRELRPSDWDKHVLGQGGAGTVYKVRWRDADVAVKVIQLPTQRESMSQGKKQAMQVHLRRLAASFTTEVDICCELNHPNLVRLLGFATMPRLYIVQEFMAGSSLYNQLYIENWCPSIAQTRKVALDVAQGMAYLHTAFHDSAHQQQAIVHRDLKSPNLLLAACPDSAGEVGDLLVKISDFGLSKDKRMDAMQHTMMMTAVGKGVQGTTLWMAPELMLTELYNEKVDVYSFAMCLLELVDCQLPWTNCCQPTLVAAKVTQGEMHLLEPQLAKAEEPIAKLARQCWARAPIQRPSFPQIVATLEELMGISGAVAAVPVAQPTPVARPEPPPPPGPPMEGRGFVRSKVDMSTDADRHTWREVCERVTESLPEYTVTRIDRLQNLDLWGRYFWFCCNLDHSTSHGSGGKVNERKLFHWAPPKTFDRISGEEGSGFETRLARGGEYGNGAYFAHHAIYPLAYQTNSCRNKKERALDWRVPPATGTKITLLWARVALGKCYNFGARCASERGDTAATAAGEPTGLFGDWPMDGHPTTGHRRRPPPLDRPKWAGKPMARKDMKREGKSYDSVCGTEANLEWTGNKRLMDGGAEFGKQFVTFNPWQAYPELVIYLEKRDQQPEPELPPQSDLDANAIRGIE